jgi:hypothetical protein
MQTVSELSAILAIMALFCGAWSMRDNLHIKASNEFGWFSRSLFILSFVTGLRMFCWDVLIPRLYGAGHIDMSDIANITWIINGLIFNPAVIIAVYCMMRALLLMIRFEDRKDYNVFTVWTYPSKFFTLPWGNKK